MSTSSITKNYTFTGEAAVRFAEAIAEALDKPKRQITVNCKEVRGEEFKEFMERVIKANDSK